MVSKCIVLLQTTLEDGSIPLWPALVAFSLMAAILVLCCLKLSQKRHKLDWLN